MANNNLEGASTSITYDNANNHIGVSTGSDSEPCIFKVHNQLRNVHKRDYDPQIIAIGPYHRGQSEYFELMEAHKLRFQELLLQRKNQQVSAYHDAIKPDYKKAQKCYAGLSRQTAVEPTAGLSPDESDDFVKMLVLDGMFIIELLLKFKKFKSDREMIGLIDKEGNDIRNDPVFRMPWALTQLQRDLMLFENQLPFFILVKLYGMIAPPGGQAEFSDLALCFLNDLFPGVGKERVNVNINTNTEAVEIKHLLDLIHMYWGSRKVSDKNVKYNMDNFELIECSTSLRETGVQFEKIDVDDDGACFDVEFKNKVLRIPVFTIEGRTESFLRNLIAFEQYSGDRRFQIVTDYMIFICCLIKSEKDFARLTRHGILRKFVNDEDASRMFKTMSDCITGPSENFHYGDIFQRVNEHYRKNHDSIGTMIRRKYMNSIWGKISLSVAAFLAALAILGLAFQILSWKSKQKTN